MSVQNEKETITDDFNKKMDDIAADLGQSPKIAAKDKELLQQEGQDLKLKMNGATSKNTDIEKKGLLDSFSEWLTKIKDFISSDKLQKIGQSILKFADKILEASAEITTSVRDFMKTMKNSENDKGLESTLKNIDVGMRTLRDVTEGVNEATSAVGSLVTDIKQNLQPNQALQSGTPSAKQVQPQKENLLTTALTDPDLQKLVTKASEGLRANIHMPKDNTTQQFVSPAGRKTERSFGR